ncbi:putative nucleotidyltransferase substrate binding domain-containing protein [Pseudonocardia ailaonensis]|uniref:putative nucleotidyltransferase substrate binding domain-containing protein n=1 Tax=Pseudonocardia ailaonensis TaxID=367279 RepID=UPI0031E0FD3F
MGGSVGEFLAAQPPFNALAEPECEKVAAAARVVDYPAATEVLDAFTEAGDDLFVVLTGQVELWTHEPGPTDPEPAADEVIGRGALFGQSSVLSRTTVGPRAVTLGPARLIQIPRAAVAEAFASPAGVRLLAADLSASRRRGVPPRLRTVDELVVSAPIVGDPAMTVRDAARLMTERGCRYVAVPQDGRFGLVTDAVLRERVLAAGLPDTTPVAEVMVRWGPTVRTGTPTGDVLRELAEQRFDYILVTDEAGALKGAVDPQDFLATPPGAGILLREQVARATRIDEVVALAADMPVLLEDLVARRRDATETTAVYSAVVDAVQRRLLTLVLAQHPDLDESEVTWLLLGSNARREPTLGSDIDSAVVFAESVTGARAAAYRAAFAEVAVQLRRAGLRVDDHGATPAAARFSRTRTQWRAAARQWLRSPLDDQGMLMASLMIDGRPVQGDPRTPAVREVFADVRDHPGTMKLLVRESLSHRAQLRSVRDVLAGRGGTFDLKTHALRPVVEIARWAALAVRAPELSTRARLAAASGSMLLSTEHAATLAEVFEVLQQIRLRQQLAQRERGETVTDLVWMRRLPRLDRTVVAQSVREISTVQKRLANLLEYSAPEEWEAPPARGGRGPGAHPG